MLIKHGRDTRMLYNRRVSTESAWPCIQKPDKIMRLCLRVCVMHMMGIYETPWLISFFHRAFIMKHPDVWLSANTYRGWSEFTVLSDRGITQSAAGSAML